MAIRSLFASAGICTLLAALTAQAAAPSALVRQFKDEKLNAEEPDAAKEKAKYFRIVQGSEAAKGNEALIEKCVAWNLYRLTWADVQRGTVLIKKTTRPDEKPIEMSHVAAIMEEVLYNREDKDGIHQMLPNPGVEPGPMAQPAAVQRFQQRTENLKVITQVMVGTKDKPGPLSKLMSNSLPVRVNAARVYARLAELGVVEVGNELEAIIKNEKEHNAVRHYAVRGLGELFAREAATPKFLPAEDYVRWVKLVYNFLNVTAHLNADDLVSLNEEEKDAVSYLRRTALIALGNTRKAQFDLGDKKTFQPPELYLQIMQNDKGIQPPTSLRERVEACRALILIENPPKSYQADFAAFEIASFISFLGGQANLDAQRTKEGWSYFSRYLTDPFRLSAGGFNESLLGDTKECRDTVKAFWPVLLHLDNNKNAASVNKLDNWLSNNKPKADRLFGPVK